MVVMLVGFLIAVAVVGVLLLGCELWSRKHTSQGELSRKFIHLTVGSFVAFWPFFLSWNQIRFLSLAFVLIVVISKRFHIFSSIHSVKRPTWGEVWFALSVGLLTFITHEQWIYAASLLQMSLADGLAAVVGVRAAPKRRYKVLGHTKSLNGTLTFFIVSVLILVLYQAVAAPLTPLSLLLISLIVTAMENAGVAGLDNILVPVFVGILLRLL